MRKLRQLKNTPSDTSKNFVGSSRGTKVNIILQGSDTERIRKQLTFGYAISDELRSKLESSANQREKYLPSYPWKVC